MQESYEVSREKGAGKKFRHRRRKGHGKEKPEALVNEEILTFYPAKLSNDQQVTAINAFSENGYSGRIELMVGIDNEGVIRNIEVVIHMENTGAGFKNKG